MKEPRKQNFSVLNFTREDVPIVTEDTRTRHHWVPVGIVDQDDYFNIVTEAYNTSTTNAACVDGIADLIFGKGLMTDDESFKEDLMRLVPAEELRRISFDLKLYGNTALQVLWNKEHTKVKKIYHTPVQTIRAEKLIGTTKVLNYFYCTDWDDIRKQREKISFLHSVLHKKKSKYYISKNMNLIDFTILYLIGFLLYNILSQKQN
jgi:hypothetical protein